MEDDQDKIMNSINIMSVVINIMSVVINIMSVVIYSLVLVLGVLGNGVVIWTTGFMMKKTVSAVWYLNLAVANLLVTAILPLGLMACRALQHGPFGWFVCMMDIVVFYMNMHASILILVVISVDRCVCVMCPLWAENHRTVRKASWVSVGVWLLALALSSPYVIFKDFNGAFWWDYPDLPKVATNSAVGFAVTFAAIVSCYSATVYGLRNNGQLVSSACKIIVTVIAVFFLCWAPYHAIWRIFVVNHPVSSGSTLYLVIRFGIPIAYSLVLLNSLDSVLSFFVSLRDAPWMELLYRCTITGTLARWWQ